MDDARTANTPVDPPSDFAGLPFRNVMARLAGGVAVVTSQDAVGRDCALTVTAVISVSLEPPLVLVSVKLDGFMHDALSVADGWIINVLATDQLELADYAARHRAPGDRDDLTPWSRSRGQHTGAAVVDGAVATVECVPYSSVDAGDHAVVIGRVVHASSAGSTRQPLVHVDRAYWQVGPSIEH